MEKANRSNHKSTKVEAGDRTEIIIRGTIRIGTDQITDHTVVTEDNTDKKEVGLDTNKIIGEETWGAMVDKIVEVSINTIIEMTVMIEAGTGLERGHFPEAIIAIETEVQVIAGPGQDPEQAQIETEFNVISVGNMITSQGLSHF